MRNTAIISIWLLKALRPVTFALLVAVGLAACGGTPAAAPQPTVAPTAIPAPTLAPTAVPSPTAEPTAAPKAEQVQLTTDDDEKLAATLFDAQGDLAVILVHMLGNSQESWQPFALVLQEQGLTALTLDLRGHGQSSGSPITSTFGKDVLAAKTFLEERGYTRAVCIGASIGASSCMNAALKAEFAGLGLIAGPIDLLPDDYAKLKGTKLFVTAEADGVTSATATETMFKLSPEPKQLKLLPGSAHGTDMFADSAAGSQLQDTLLEFLKAIKG